MLLPASHPGNHRLACAFTHPVNQSFPRSCLTTQHPTSQRTVCSSDTYFFVAKPMLQKNDEKCNRLQKRLADHHSLLLAIMIRYTAAVAAAQRHDWQLDTQSPSPRPVPYVLSLLQKGLASQRIAQLWPRKALPNMCPQP